jgi:hypothetical protein
MQPRRRGNILQEQRAEYLSGVGFELIQKTAVTYLD